MATVGCVKNFLHVIISLFFGLLIHSLYRSNGWQKKKDEVEPLNDKLSDRCQNEHVGRSAGTGNMLPPLS